MAAYSAQPRAIASEPFSERRINGVSMYLFARANTLALINGTRAVPPYLFARHNSVVKLGALVELDRKRAWGDADRTARGHPF
jgi:hypothetical protein|eukprot:COSAG02_NODE_9030_length_2356_cov_1.189189_4_plen_83_part_00